MLVVVSPAKKLDMKQINLDSVSEPDFKEQTQELVNIMRAFRVDDVKSLMGISEKLAALNVERFSKFGTQNRKQAAFAFAGDTYKGLDIKTLEHEDLVWAQGHLRIISGLYGLLRPLDSIEPYRLEMGSRLKTSIGNSLYDFWGKELSKSLNYLAQESQASLLVNCASKEYFNAIDEEALNIPVVTPTFFENKSGENKMVSFYSKKARGAMARFIVQNKLQNRNDLEKFCDGGYQYQKNLSDGQSIVFVR